jgi:hypothetical protein
MALLKVDVEISNLVDWSARHEDSCSEQRQTRPHRHEVARGLVEARESCVSGTEINNQV